MPLLPRGDYVEPDGISLGGRHLSEVNLYPKPPPRWDRAQTISDQCSTRSTDVFYTAPTGKRLHSMEEIMTCLPEHHEEVASGVNVFHSSFQTPKTVQKNHVINQTSDCLALPVNKPASEGVSCGEQTTGRRSIFQFRDAPLFPCSMETLRIPRAQAGAITSRPGKRRLKQMRAESGAQFALCNDVRLDPLVAPDLMVDLLGTCEQIEKAKQLLNDVLAAHPASTKSCQKTRHPAKKSDPYRPLNPIRCGICNKEHSTYWCPCRELIPEGVQVNEGYKIVCFVCGRESCYKDGNAKLGGRVQLPLGDCRPIFRMKT